jgi:hypothetical protein
MYATREAMSDHMGLASGECGSFIAYTDSGRSVFLESSLGT